MKKPPCESLSQNLFVRQFCFDIRMFLFTICILIFAGANHVTATVGLPDNSFAPILLSNPAEADAIAVQPGGRILIAGSFVSVGGLQRQYLARLHPNGTIDSDFSPMVTGKVEALILQPDGKILIGGDFGFVNGILRSRIARLNSDGSLDLGFSPGSGANCRVDAISLQSGGKILIGGEFTSYNGIGRSRVARLNPNGSLDAAFNPGTGADGPVLDLENQSDGKVVIVGNFTAYNGTTRRSIARLNSEGSLDITFNAAVFSNNVLVRSVAIQSDGKVIAAGYFNISDGSARNGIIRMSTDGSVDMGFNTGFSEGAGVQTVVVQPDGKIMVGGGRTYSGRYALARLNADGTLDSGFDAGIPPDTDFTSSFVTSLFVMPGGVLLVGGRVVNYGGTVREGIARLNNNGSLDISFNAGLVRDAGDVDTLAVQADGRILIGGFINFVNGSERNVIARLNPDGSLDTTFNPIFNATTSSARSYVSKITIQSDGKILIGGIFASVNGTARNGLVRLNSDGSVDTAFNTTFGNIPHIEEITLQTDGKILIGGFFTTVGGVSRNSIARLNSEGTLDTSFDPGTGTGFGGAVHHAVVQPDGKIVIGGVFGSFNGTPRNGIARLNANGSLETGFNPTLDAFLPTVLLQPDDKIVIGGRFTSVNGIARKGVARLNSDGTLDTSFDPGSGTGNDDDYGVRGLAIQSDGRIFIVGEFTSFNGVDCGGIARLNSNGSLDSSFRAGRGADDEITDVVLQPNGKIYINGIFQLVNGRPFQGLARLLDFPRYFDYDGDGRTDFSVFRPSQGAWYLQKSTEGFFGMLFGFSTDKITPADFDGDGKTDIAIFRPSDQRWYIANSSNGTYRTEVFGLSNDIPAPADYDGDGKADLCVFRPSDGTWYRQNSSNGSFFAYQFGTNGDKPTIGDFDGDGKSDIAVFRVSNGEWYQVYSSDGSIHGERFGFSTDKLAYADYDGDGKTDMAVFRPSERVFYIKNSQTSTYTAFVFGLSDDIPTPGDYDGDGKADLSVFRPSEGNWYRQNSSNGSFFAFNFGLNGDKPTPTAYH